MKIAVIGGTGFVGKALCENLARQGHRVSALSRDRGPWPAAIDGADAVVNLAGESIADGRWTAGRKRALYDSRILTTRAIVAMMSGAKVRPKILVNASAVGYYGNAGDRECEEPSPAGRDFLAKLCLDWEAEAAKAEGFGARVIFLRLGVVLGPGGGALAKMIPPFKLFAGGPLGSGNQWMSWISRDDVIGLIQHILSGDLSGPVNAVSPRPATNKDFSAALGRALHRPSWIAAPAFALRLALGEMAGMLLAGQRVIPARALKSGYVFKHPDIDSALRSILLQ